jgi:hypothetical protein
VLAEDINGFLVRDNRATIEAALLYFVERSGTASIHAAYLQPTCHLEQGWIVAVGSNYSITGLREMRAVKMELPHICKLMQAEGLLEPEAATRWYLDWKKWQWTHLQFSSVVRWTRRSRERPPLITYYA